MLTFDVKPAMQRRKGRWSAALLSGAAGSRTQRRNRADLEKCCHLRRETTRKHAKRPADTRQVLMASTTVTTT